MAMRVVYTTINGQIVHENRAGTEAFYAPDTLGSTAMLLSAGGSVTDTYTYWPYGEIQSHVGSSITPFTFCGTLGYYLDVLGSQIYVRARYLRQALARWQTVDALWPGMKPFVYANSAPTLFIDPTGMGPKHSTRQLTPTERLNLAEGDGCVAASFLFAGQVTGSAIWRDFLACLSETGCAPPDASQMACLANNACGGVSTYLDFSDGTDCGEYMPGACAVFLYPPALGENPRCDHFKAGAQYHIVYLHEMLHSCGYDHPSSARGDASCNNILSCCMLRSMGYLPPSQRCRPK
jgi:RHS repeat-associated protein